MKKVKIGIIGIGNLGTKHLKTVTELSEHTELIGIHDVSKESAPKLAERYGTKFFDSNDDLAQEVEAVIICVPTEHHHKIAKFYLEKGIHTFIEKPLTQTIAEADDLIRIADEKKLILQVGHVERFNTAFESIKHFTVNPLFIECHRLNKFPHRSLDIGVVMDLMIHDIDIILGLNNSPIKSIDAIGINVLTSLEDIANVRLTFENNCVCNLTASRVSEEVTRKIRIFQENTYISLDYVKQEAFIYKKHDDSILKHSLPIEKEQPLTKEIIHFAECIRNQQTPIVSGVEGRDAMDVALQISEIIWKKIKK